MEIICSSCGKIIPFESFPEDQQIEIKSAIDRGVCVVTADMCPECKKKEKTMDHRLETIKLYNTLSAITAEKFTPHPNITDYALMDKDVYNFSSKKQSLKKFEIDLQIKRIIFNGPATIVFWEDGTKTVVKISEDDIRDGKFDIYTGVSYAIAKKLFGTNSAFKREVDRKITERIC